MSGNSIEFVPNHTGVFGRVLRPYRTNTGTPGIVVEGIPVPGVPRFHTELTELSGTGIEVVPNIPVSSSYRTMPECSVGY